PVLLLSSLVSSLVSLYCLLFPHSHRDHPNLPSFPTRRSSDLKSADGGGHHPGHLPRGGAGSHLPRQGQEHQGVWRGRCDPAPPRDRKSTRLNSSHGSISYAVFCLKKKKSN